VSSYRVLFATATITLQTSISKISKIQGGISMINWKRPIIQGQYRVTITALEVDIVFPILEVEHASFSFEVDNTSSFFEADHTFSTLEVKETSGLDVTFSAKKASTSLD
ncbi:21636_t:CDS:2, partial [Gigaspora rosea]